MLNDMPADHEQTVGLAGESTLLDGYAPLPRTYDELFRGDGSPRDEVADLVAELGQFGRAEFVTRQKLAEGALFRGGVTFSVYSDSRGQEKIFPFDLIPRVIPASVWNKIERGLVQRVTALNMFLSDLYDGQRIIKEGKIPDSVVFGTTGYLKELHGMRPTEGVFVNIAGIDLIRGGNGDFLVLEDNLRTPSGVSYVLENRMVMQRVFPGVFRRSRVRPVGSYVHDKRVFVKTTAGPQQVDVIYRRIDDDFLDPRVFNETSVLGVPGVLEAYAAGNVTLANAPGNGVADNKAVYPFVPNMIRFYLDEEPILGQVETYICARPNERDHVLANLKSMVVKAVDGSGGYGLLFGPRASQAEIAEFAEKIREEPEGYIAQPVVELSTCPTWIDGEAAPRRVDLRPFVLTGKSSWVLPGGLTRVALNAGSYVVNSSQGGGSKDTWVLEDHAS
jgi:uncharacterized circularly permuted ATP-grasp superfamily protein